MSWFEIVFGIILVLYGIQGLIIVYGSSKKFKKVKSTTLPSATVIVAARNEEGNILRCMEALHTLKYDNGELEILIVDDHSTDRTAEIIDSYIKDKPGFKRLEAPEPSGTLRGKANALDFGIKNAMGEIILTTDADCAVSATWAETIVSYYTDDVGMVFGYTDQETGSQFYGMQSLDFIYLLSVAASTINIDYPTSCIGNNMSFRKSAYLDVGGYGALPFSVTEDFMLMMAIHKTGKHRLVYPRDPKSMVTSQPCPDWKILLHQKKRWAVGGLDSALYGFAIMATGFAANAMVLMLPLFFSVNGFYFALVKFALDAGILLASLVPLRITNHLKYFVSFQLYFIFYVLSLPFIVLPNKKVTWKERKF